MPTGRESVGYLADRVPRSLAGPRSPPRTGPLALGGQAEGAGAARNCKNRFGGEGGWNIL